MNLPQVNLIQQELKRDAMMSDDHSKSYLKQIAISNIPSDIYRLGLSKQVTDLLIEGGIFFISQIEKMTEYELKQLQGISSITAEKIKRTFYRYRWRTNQNRTIKSIEDLKLLIETSPRKKDILKISIDEFNLPANAYIAFDLSGIKTIKDILPLSELEIFKIRGIGKIRYNGIINSILKVVNLYEGGIVSVDKLKTTDPLDNSLYTQPNLSFLEVFTKLLNTTKPRNREIFFEYYFSTPIKKITYTAISKKYDLSQERIRQICERELRLLHHPERMNCITTYLNTVWKIEVHNFVIANGGYVTRLELEQQFSDDLPEIYFLQDEIFKINDIWADVLAKNEEYYYLPFLQREKVDRIKQAISEEIKKYEWGIDIEKLIEIIDNQLTLSHFLSDRSKDVIVGIIKKFDILEIAGNEVRLAMRRNL